MAAAKRLMTFVDVTDVDPSPVDVELTDGRRRQLRPSQVAVSARHELELKDGRRVLLLNDRGWGSSGNWTLVTVENIQETTRQVVGPDAPFDGKSKQEMEAEHWASLQLIAEREGVIVDAEELRQLPHDVVLSQRLLARIGTDQGADTSD